MHHDALVHPNEKSYFAIVLAVSVFAYFGLVISGVGLVYIVVGGLFALVANGLFLGRIRGNAVKVSETQLPDVHRATREMCAEMGLAEVPDVYVLQAGGVLNAFATRFLGRSFVILLSDLVELARGEGEAALRFVICHELAHHHRKHTARRLLLAPGMMIPFLGSAYSRACEYTCDAYGAYHVPAGAVRGLLVLAAGKMLYREIDPPAFAAQAEQETGFFVWLSEILSTHPHLPRRVGAAMAHARRRIPAPEIHEPTPFDEAGVAAV